MTTINSEITKDSQVTLHFSIALTDGNIVDDTKKLNKPARFKMGDGNLSPNFENALLGLKANEEKSISLKAEDAFGMPNPDNIHHMDRNRFLESDPIAVGTIMSFQTGGDMEIPGIITEINGESVTVDFNHPLVGKDVVFNVHILEIE